MEQAAPSPRLTQYSRAGGCGCKVSSSVLRSIVSHLPMQSLSSDIIAGLEDYDDAAVLRITADTALALSIDAFTPLFDDPKTFGRVAAANAVSDIYATGLKPVIAQGFLGWPVDSIPLHWANQVLAGAIEFCSEIGVHYAGGHTINSLEPVFGLCVNGVGPSANVKLNSTGRAGDLLYLTKPLGTGVISTAEKKGLLTSEHRTAALQFAAAPNLVGEALGATEAVHALTDVTGFGLVGHLLEMITPKNLGAILHLESLQSHPGFAEYLALGCETSGAVRNRSDFKALVDMGPDQEDHLLMDPQSNGGLLIACDASKRSEIEEILSASGLSRFAVPIGRLTERGDAKPIQIA